MSELKAEQEALVSTHEHPVRLPVFEGPLDLLLYLIRRNEVDIYDIPIETVTRQYLDTLASMEQLDLEVAGEFFVMAATLMVIKSRMLLPKNEQPQEEDEDNEVDPRWELVQQLIEYKKFKVAASELQDMILARHDLIARQGPTKSGPREDRPLTPADRLDIWNTFNMVLRRLAERIQEGEIHAENVTVADRMEYLLDLLTRKQRFFFSGLFEASGSVVTIVATFLAILELARMGRIQLTQNRAFADIECVAAE